eukprot:843267-Prorocentrum_minimum.AAC.1
MLKDNAFARGVGSRQSRRSRLVGVDSVGGVSSSGRSSGGMSSDEDLGNSGLGASGHATASAALAAGPKGTASLDDAPGDKGLMSPSPPLKPVPSRRNSLDDAHGAGAGARVRQSPQRSPSQRELKELSPPRPSAMPAPMRARLSGEAREPLSPASKPPPSAAHAHYTFASNPRPRHKLPGAGLDGSASVSHSHADSPWSSNRSLPPSAARDSRDSLDPLNQSCESRDGPLWPQARGRPLSESVAESVAESVSALTHSRESSLAADPRAAAPARASDGSAAGAGAHPSGARSAEGAASVSASLADAAARIGFGLGATSRLEAEAEYEAEARSGGGGAIEGLLSSRLREATTATGAAAAAAAAADSPPPRRGSLGASALGVGASANYNSTSFSDHEEEPARAPRFAQVGDLQEASPPEASALGGGRARGPAEAAAAEGPDAGRLRATL